MKLKKPNKVLALMAGISVGVGVVHASTTPISLAVKNFSFETPVVGDGNTNAGATSWKSFGQQGYTSDPLGQFTGDTPPPGTLPGTADGSQYFVENGPTNGGPNGIYQTIGPVLPNVTYTLTVAIGQANSIASGQGMISLVNGSSTNGTVLASNLVNVTLAPSGSFADATVTFSTGTAVSGNLTIVLESTAGTQIGFDNIRLAESIPGNATLVNVTNSSFEITPPVPPGTGSGLPEGWTHVGFSESVENPLDGIIFPGYTNSMPPPGDGTYCFSANANNGAYVDVGHLLPNKTYTMIVAVSGDGVKPQNDGASSIQLINGTAYNNGSLLVSGTVNNTNLFIWTDFGVTYTTGSSVSGDLTLYLSGGPGIQTYFDNVRLYTQVPASLLPVPTVPSVSSPEPGTVYAGDVVTVSEAATGPGPLFYQWQFDNGTGGATWANLAGFSTNNTSFVQNTTNFTSPAYEFRVAVTNISGSVTSAPVVMVMATNGMPIALANPFPSYLPIEVSAGLNITLPSAFTGTRPFSYQWLDFTVNGYTNVLDGLGGTANSPTLILPNVTSADATTFELMATNAYGTATAGTYNLLVDPQPSPDLYFNNLILVGFEHYNNPFISTFYMAPGSLIAGLLPVDQQGNFSWAATNGYPGIGSVTNLTSGQPITVGANSSMVLVGGPASNSGQYLTYQLNTNAAPAGYNLTSVVALGGWASSVDCQTAGDVYYSTVSNPGTFVELGYYDAQMASPPGGQVIENEAMVVPSSGSYLAQNVSSVKFTFYAFEVGDDNVNQYTGLNQLQVFGTPAQNLTCSQSGSSLVMNWVLGSLYQASSVKGPWTAVVGATSPWTVSTTAGPAMFFTAH